VISIAEAAIAARREVAFYEWLYRREGLSDGDLLDGHTPVFSKKDIWEYEEQSGSPYYVSPRLPSDLSTVPMISTSGTTSRTLQIPVINAQGRGSERAHESMDLAFRDVLGATPVMWMQPELSPAIKSIMDQNAKYSGAEYRFISCRLPIVTQLEQARAAGATVLLDITGLTTPQIVQAQLNPREYGIRVVSCAYLPRSLSDYLAGKGVSSVFYFTAADSIVLHLGCPYCPTNEFHIRTTLSLHEVAGEDGSVEPLGEGLYVSTIPAMPFPPIRYTNGDMIRIAPTECRCGFRGNGLTFMGRTSHAKLGATGPLLNYEQIYSHYSAKPENLGVSILFGRLAERVHEQRFYVFLERQVDSPSVVDGAWKEVMTIGAGGPDTNFIEYVKVVVVPVGSIGHHLQHKRVVFTDLSRARGPLAEQLTKLARDVTGERLV